MREEKKALLMGGPVENPLYTPAQEALRWSKFKNRAPEDIFDLFVKPQVDDLTVFEHMKQIGEKAAF